MARAIPPPQPLSPLRPCIEAVRGNRSCRSLFQGQPGHRALSRTSTNRPRPEARKRVEDSLKLQYYFDGIDIAYRRIPQSLKVVAVGFVKVGELIRTTPQEQQEGVVFGQG